MFLSFSLSLSVQLYTNLPEPEDLFAASGIMPVDCASLPVHQVYLLHPTQHHLQSRRKPGLYCEDNTLKCGYIFS